ncbi:MAG TPA: prenyltransferase/squalene oxidase repeat-containing protein [Solirubrobacterales bacterium]|nr:prenyltransferase/squalene oxidase repeat-containing protein [Solirubrobacterales bacterium]
MGSVRGTLALIALALLVPAGSAAADVGTASVWLVGQQNGDGGYGAEAGQASRVDTTCWAMLGLAASGVNPFDVAKESRSAVDFLRGRLGEVTLAGDLARAVLALEAAGADPRDFGGQNLVARLRAKQRGDGSFEGQPSATALAAIALRTAGATGGVEANLGWLHGAQNDDGGWGESAGAPSSANATGAVLQALSPGTKASKAGLSFLRNTQRKGGGFAPGTEGAVNTESTAWAVQGIVAAGGDPASFRRGGASALDYLTAHQETDGHYRYSGESDENPVRTTAQAIPAASSAPFPISTPPRAPKPSQSSFSTPGVLPSSPVAPAPGLEAPVVPPSGSETGGAGPLANTQRPPGKAPKAPAAKQPSGGRVREGPGTPGPAPAPPDSVRLDSESEPEASSDDLGSTLGAAGLGLAAGGLLFGAAWAGRRGWMRWRYGI